MDYCTDFAMWVEEIEATTGSICPVWVQQLMDGGEIRGCEGCRLLKHVKGGKKG